METNEQRTQRRLEEMRHVSRFGQDRDLSFARKPIDAPLTKSERAALDLCSGIGLDLGGNWSNSLTYADALRRLPVLQHRAILSLLDRGRLTITFDGTSERIIWKCIRTEVA